MNWLREMSSANSSSEMDLLFKMIEGLTLYRATLYGTVVVAVLQGSL